MLRTELAVLSLHRHIGLIVVACAGLSSCSSGDAAPPGDSGTGGGGADGSGTGGSGTGGGGPGDASIIQPARDSGLIIVADGAIMGTVGGGSLDDAACATATRTADRTPLDIYIMLDSS